MDELAIHYDNLFPEKQNDGTQDAKKFKKDETQYSDEMPPLRTMTFINLIIPKIALCWIFVAPSTVRNIHLRMATLYGEFERENWFTLTYYWDDRWFDTRKQDELEWGICWDDYRWFSYIARFIGPLKPQEERTLLKLLRDEKVNTTIKEELENRDVLDSLSDGFWDEFQTIDSSTIDLDWICKWNIWTQRFLLNFAGMHKEATGIET
ncbi:uncharacterized protein LOC129598494 isoform X2 [Paramacrobiotus metropolitanus]|uniref:uncharacterized protein LOC129598494 isoform X2 n=1 Tax=Paramacrobiotus metropolitanus TaxID=2943436 RepID=UPI002445BECC|nr:uncharacterized protein LOC129598494 isoform X2 [Paramacrobiotus metropolitanus]